MTINDRIAQLPVELREVYRKRCQDRCFWSFWAPARRLRHNKLRREWYIPVLWNTQCKLMFVAQQPSSNGDFPTTRDSRFWNLAVRSGLAQKHDEAADPCEVFFRGPFVTELVPRRSKVEDAEPLDGWGHSDWAQNFIEELHQVKPVLLVAMGTTVFETLRRLDGLDLPIERVTHHGALRFSNESHPAEEKLEFEFARVKRVYSNLTEDRHSP